MSARRRAAALPLLLAMALCSGADSDPRKAQQIAFPEIPQHAVGDAPFSLAAKASSGLPLTFSLVAGPADIDGRLVKLSGQPGLVIVRASQAGNELFQPATDAERAFTVTARPAAPVIVTQPASRSVGFGEPILIEVAASGEPRPTYQWLKDGVGVSRGDGARLVIDSAGPGDGGEYVAVVTNRLGSVKSAPIRVDVHKRSQEIVFSEPAAVPAGRPISLVAYASSGLTVTFEVVSGMATLSGSTLTPTGGVVVIRATQPGNALYAGAPEVTRSFIVYSGPGATP